MAGLQYYAGMLLKINVISALHKNDNRNFMGMIIFN